MPTLHVNYFEGRNPRRFGYREAADAEILADPAVVITTTRTHVASDPDWLDARPLRRWFEPAWSLPSRAMALKAGRGRFDHVSGARWRRRRT